MFRRGGHPLVTLSILNRNRVEIVRDSAPPRRIMIDGKSSRPPNSESLPESEDENPHRLGVCRLNTIAALAGSFDKSISELFKGL